MFTKYLQCKPSGSKAICLLLACALALTAALAPLPARAREAARLTITVHFDTITGTLYGFVFDPGALPLGGVRIRVRNLETDNVRATLTDANGRYEIRLLPLGIYSIEASKSGYRLKSNAREPVKIQLNKPTQPAPDIILEIDNGQPPVVAATTPTPQPAVPASAAGVAGGGQEEELGRATNLDDATRRSNIDEQTVSLLPLAGIRSFDDLALLAAGVAPPPQVRGVAGPGIGAGIGTAGQFAVNGQRARSNNFTVDGSDNNDEDVGVRRQGFIPLVPQSVESIKEIQIVTHLWDAELGRSSGSQVNAVSKSGTNQLHGSLYDFFNHSALNARNFFDYSDDKTKSYALTAQAFGQFTNGQPNTVRTVPVIIRTSNPQSAVPVMQANPSQGKDQYQRNQGGGALGFPIWKGRTFFFGSFERQDIKARQETHFAVPTVGQRGFLGYGATGFTAKDRTGVTQSFTPTSVAGDAVLSLFPFPNNPIGPYGDNTFTEVLPADGHGTLFSGKLDHSFEFWGAQTFTARYNFTDDARQVTTVGGALFSGVKPRVRTQNVSLFLNSQPTASSANQLRLSYGRTALDFDEIRDPYLLPSEELPNEKFLLNAPLIGNLTLPEFSQNSVDYRRYSTLTTEGQLSTIGQVIVQPFSPIGLDVNLFPQSRRNNTIQTADTYTRFNAAHTWKFGFDIRRTQLNSTLNRNYRPQVIFGGSPDLTARFSQAPVPNISQFGPTPGYFTGTDLASLGIPTGIFQSLAIGTPDSTIGLRLWQLNFFANDNWRARRGLTIDYGARYELNTVPHEVNNRIENTFDLAQLPTANSNIAITPTLNGRRIELSNQALLNSFNATVSALKAQIGNRDSIFDPDRNNMGGHVGFAWDPFAGTREQAGKTAVRGGFGVYYDLTLGSVVSQSRNVFPTFLPLNIDANTFAYARDALYSSGSTGYFGIFNPRYLGINYQGQSTDVGLIQPGQLNVLQAPSGALQQLLGLLFDPSVAGTGSSGGGIAYTLPDRNLRSPYALQYNLQIERELYGDFLLNLAYVGSRGVKLTRFRTPNGGPNSVTLPIDPLGFAANPVLAIALPPLSDLSTNTFARPNRRLGAYTVFDSSAASNYHSLQVGLNKRFARGFQVSAAYTWSHAIDDVSDVFDVAGAYALPQDDRALLAERGSANFDIRHRFALSSIGGLPLLTHFTGRGGARGFLLGGWQYSLLTTLQTGQPFTVNTSFDVNIDGNYTDRIDTLNGLTMIDSRQQRLALSTTPLNLLATLGTNGRIGRNAFRASGVARADLALVKNFTLRTGQYLVFRAEAFNVGNRTHFAIPVRVLEAPSFGRSTETSISARQIQFVLKYVF